MPYVFSQTTESVVCLRGTGFGARENTAKMAVPPIKQLRLNTYKGRKPAELITNIADPTSFGGTN
ncbi:MAG: hypothetical protein ABIL62_14970, partial [Planctomycetota bacterium]